MVPLRRPMDVFNEMIIRIIRAVHRVATRKALIGMVALRRDINSSLISHLEGSKVLRSQYNKVVYFHLKTRHTQIKDSMVSRLTYSPLPPVRQYNKVHNFHLKTRHIQIKDSMVSSLNCSKVLCRFNTIRDQIKGSLV